MVPSSTGGPDLSSPARSVKPKKNASGTGTGYGSGSGSGQGSGRGSGSGVGDGNTSVSAPKSIPVTPEMLREQKLKEKLHSWVYALVDRLRLRKNDPTPNEAKFVRDGKAEIVVLLNSTSSDMSEKLKAIGFVISSTKDGINITGRVAIEKLAVLAELDGVKLILPKVR